MDPGLYVVATPIGNLGDVTQRALDTLASVAMIAAEDTRNTRGLLAHFGISAKLVALHAHNERAAAEGIVKAIEGGGAVALVSDAGTPGISDPGAIVVARVREAGHKVIPIPGASALVAALSASGLEFDGVVFAGFLPTKGADRRARLQALAAGPWAIVLYEAPHRVVETVRDLHAALGERTLVVAREITKKFETITSLPLSEAAAWLEGDDDRRRGEFALVIEGKEPAQEASALDSTLRTLLEELPLKQAVAIAAKLTGEKRNAVYERALALKG